MTRLLTMFTALVAFGAATSSTGNCASRISPLRLSWVQHQPIASPPPRLLTACAYDSVSQKVVMFGGTNGAAQDLAETWTYDGTTWTLVSTPVSPPGRRQAAMAFDAVRHVLILAGGFHQNQFADDTWLWDGATSTWTQATPTASLVVASPTLFTDPANGHVDAFGGSYGAGFSQRMFQWNGGTWVPLYPHHSPQPRAGGVAALDRPHHRVVMFGGFGAFGVDVNNTWRWDGEDWTMESPTAQPPGPVFSGAAFEPHLGQVVVYGGATGAGRNDETWEWTGSDWAELQPVQAPQPRSQFAMAYDEALGSIVVFGGVNASSFILNDTWHLAVQP